VDKFIYAKVITNPKGETLNAIVKIPVKTGDEGFAFIASFQKKCGVTPRRDVEADIRIAALDARDAERAAKERARR
jgi:hypothetical protein